LWTEASGRPCVALWLPSPPSTGEPKRVSDWGRRAGDEGAWHCKRVPAHSFDQKLSALGGESNCDRLLKDWPQDDAADVHDGDAGLGLRFDRKRLFSGGQFNLADHARDHVLKMACVLNDER